MNYQLFVTHFLQTSRWFWQKWSEIESLGVRNAHCIYFGASVTTKTWFRCEKNRPQFIDNSSTVCADTVHSPHKVRPQSKLKRSNMGGKMKGFPSKSSEILR